MSALAKKQRAYGFGDWAEKLCCVRLMIDGFAIINRRYKCRYGEIDIVARKDSQLVFVEVKARQGHEDALYAIQPRQQQRITRTAMHWLSAHETLSMLEMRFDVMVVNSYGKIQRIENAFEAVS
ncbi:MAG: YraN family protein [Rickettsiales bacterium]|nr:YraN family protein [Rickettsiales bacterium]